jgi:hypothetical protein
MQSIHHQDAASPRPEAAPPARVGVVSGRYPASEFESFINHKAYCARHGYTYIHCNWPTGAANQYMNKLEYVRAYYHLFDYLFWIDDDAFFMRPEQALEAFVPQPGQFLSICGSPTSKPIHTYVSSGQFMLRCDDTGRAFIDAVTKVDLDHVRSWWTEALGYFTGGDQDAMVYLLKQDDRFASYQRHGYEAFNSRVEHLLAGDPVFLLHFTGTVPVKRRNYASVQQHLGRGPSLLDPDEASRWQLVQPPPSLPRKIGRSVLNILRRAR